MVAIAGIPHVTGQSQFQQEGAMIVASIVNLYLVILIAAILLSLLLANSISKPLTQISDNLSKIDLGPYELSETGRPFVIKIEVAQPVYNDLNINSVHRPSVRRCHRRQRVKSPENI